MISPFRLCWFEQQFVVAASARRNGKPWFQPASAKLKDAVENSSNNRV
jgi:hypothetical protein